MVCCAACSAMMTYSCPLGVRRFGRWLKRLGRSMERMLVSDTRDVGSIPARAAAHAVKLSATIVS